MPPGGTPSAAFIIKGLFIIDGLATQFSETRRQSLVKSSPPTDETCSMPRLSQAVYRAENRANRQLSQMRDREIASSDLSVPLQCAPRSKAADFWEEYLEFHVCWEKFAKKERQIIFFMIIFKSYILRYITQLRLFAFMIYRNN